MILRFEPSGTHIHKGYRKVRFDLIPQPTDKTYAIYHIYYQDETSKEFLRGYKGKLNTEGSPVDQVDYNVWWDGLPKVWKTNPCLLYLLVIDGDETRTQIKQMLLDIFDKDTVSLLKGKLSQPVINLRDVTKLRPPVVASKVNSIDIEAINTRFSSMEVQL